LEPEDFTAFSNFTEIFMIIDSMMMIMGHFRRLASRGVSILSTYGYLGVAKTKGVGAAPAAYRMLQ
jgi:hypothetical protein